jgi:hypothetical protein
MTYALVLILTLSGQPHIFIVDSGLMLEDCRQAVEANKGTASITCELETEEE